MLVPLSAIAFFTYIFVEESPSYYLFVEKDQAECIGVLHRIAKINGKSFVEC